MLDTQRTKLLVDGGYTRCYCRHINQFQLTQMTNQVEKVSPADYDGIEFYCSANGEETGMSHRGLFKFVGIPRTTGQRLIGVLDKPAQHKFPESLERWNAVSIFHDNITGSNDAKGAHIIKAEFCADFCSYIAYEYNGGNKIARYSLKKFAAIGIKTFIQELSGFKTVSPSSEINQILSILGGMQTQISDMSTKLDKAQGYFKASVTYSGLEAWLGDETMADDMLYLPDSDPSWYTIEEAINQLFPNITFEKGTRISVGMMVAATWKSMHQSLPTKVVRLDDKGYRRPPVAAYPASFLPLIKNDVIKFVVTL